MNSSDGFFISERDQGSLVWFLGTLMNLRATGEQTRDSFGLIEQVLPPGFTPPLHIHHGEDEAFYLLEGQASFTCGDRTAQAQPGSFIFFPRDIPHWFRIEGDQPARLLQFNFPAGLEHFFQQAGEHVADPKTPPAGPPDFEKMASAAPVYRLEILGPIPER
jgi:quercetin dioxygenase-like cupin family protein